MFDTCIRLFCPAINSRKFCARFQMMSRAWETGHFNPIQRKRKQQLAGFSGKLFSIMPTMLKRACPKPQ